MKIKGRAAILVLIGAVALFALWGYLTFQRSHPAASTKAASSHAAAATTAATKATSGAAVDPATKLPWVATSDLPKEARDTLGLIDRGGPYPYPNNDGVVFHNAEGHLPKQKSGYYHEYTVKTPGSPDRGARRIITGSDGEYFYTDDHYATFARIRR